MWKRHDILHQDWHNHRTSSSSYRPLVAKTHKQNTYILMNLHLILLYILYISIIYSRVSGKGKQIQLVKVYNFFIPSSDQQQYALTTYQTHLWTDSSPLVLHSCWLNKIKKKLKFVELEGIGNSEETNKKHQFLCKRGLISLHDILILPPSFKTFCTGAKQVTPNRFQIIPNLRKKWNPE